MNQSSTLGLSRWFVFCVALLQSPAAMAQRVEVQWDRMNKAALDLYDEGKYEQSVQVAQEALRFAEANFDRNNRYLGVAYNNLAFIYLELGRYQDAVTMMERSIKITEYNKGSDHEDFALALNNLGTSYTQIGEYTKAESMHIRAL